MISEERRQRQRANRRMKRQAEHKARMAEKHEREMKRYESKEQYVSYFNHERYKDPVAAAAINSVVRQRRRIHA